MHNYIRANPWDSYLLKKMLLVWLCHYNEIQLREWLWGLLPPTPPQYLCTLLSPGATHCTPHFIRVSQSPRGRWRGAVRLRNQPRSLQGAGRAGQLIDMGVPSGWMESQPGAGGMETDTPSMAAALLWVLNTVGCRVGSGNLQTTKQYKQNTQRASAPPRAGAALSAYTAGSSRTVSVAPGCGMGEVAHPHTQQHDLTAHPLLFSAKPTAEPPTTHPISAGSAGTLLETFAPKAPLSPLTSAPVLTTAAGNAQWPFAAPPPWGQSCHWEAVA